MLLALALVLTAAGPASAAPAATSTAATISDPAAEYFHSELVTVKNTGSEPITSFVIDAGEEPGVVHIVPGPACSEQLSTGNAGTILCNLPLAPGAMAEVCFTPPTEAPGFLGFSVKVRGAGGEETKYALSSASPAVTSCPVAGFKKGLENQGPGTPGSGNPGMGTPPPSATTTVPGTTKCVVPKLKGKSLKLAKKAIIRAHCAVGKVKNAGSRRVKKGSVVSQGQPAGKSLPSGARINLTVSKG